MISIVIKRVAGAIPTLFAIVTLTFLMMRLTPGGPFDRGHAVSPEVQANLMRAYHLDEPLTAQYLRYLKDLAHGDFGPSFTNKDFTVTQLIRQGFPVSLQLGLSAMALALVIGLALGTYGALHRNRPSDHAVVAFSLVGTIVPNFVMAPLLTLLFGVTLRWLPAGGWGDGHQLSYKILPVIALALPRISSIARLSRTSMIEALQMPYIRTARAKGLPRRLILLRHASRAAILPVVSYLGPATAGIITGSIIIEQVFSIPGIGRYFVDAAINRDYTLVSGVVVFYGTIIVIFNLIVDILYGVLDPRVGKR
ncbi:MAG: oligopeptide ABC transporter permease OppB [Telmatospirillum sp.]|nr:oligopeptide ABC transporter permease OppB [Telmatospirillum sp.]